MIGRSIVGLVAVGLASAFALPAGGQPNAVVKTTLQDQEFPPPIYHSVTVRTVIRKGGEVAPHTHPGVEMAYIVSGHALVTEAGKPPQSLSDGGSFSIAPRIVHSVRNVGRGGLVIISTYVVDKSQPIASPAR